MLKLEATRQLNYLYAIVKIRYQLYFELYFRLI
jgi:hypothetical protein